MTCLDLLCQCWGKSVFVYFESDSQGCGRRHSGPDAAVLRAFNGSMQLQCASPEIRVAKRVIAENVSALLNKVFTMLIYLCIGRVEMSSMSLLRIKGKDPG